MGVIPRYPSFNEADVSDKPTWVRRLDPVDPQEMDSRRASKYRQALSLDEAIERFVTTLERRNIFNRTVIIFMTDNGVSLGEHRFVGKPCEFEECIKTPLIISYPMAQIGHSKIIPELVANVDIAPSIAEMAGAQIPPLDGVSFVPLLEGKTVSSWREAGLLRWGGYSGRHPCLRPHSGRSVPKIVRALESIIPASIHRKSSTSLWKRAGFSSRKAPA